MNATVEKHGLIRSGLFRGAIFVAYLALLGGGAEMLVRTLNLAEPHNEQPRLAIKLFHSDPNGLVLLRPNARYYTNGEVPMVINRDGYRDQIYPPERTPGTRRIVILGDSFTMGDGVPIEDSYPKQLERLYRAAGKKVEVLNFGITATNTLNHLALLKAKVPDYAPDLVILGFNLNDYLLKKESPFESARRRFGFYYSVNPDQTVTMIPPLTTGLDSFKQALYRRSALLRALYSAKKSFASAGRQVAWPVMTSLAEFRRDVTALPRSPVSAAIVTMDRMASERGIGFLCVVLPAMTMIPRNQVKNFDQYPFTDVHAQLTEFMDHQGVSHLDVLEAFDGSIRSVVVSRFDPHFNRRGNAIIATAIKEALE